MKKVYGITLILLASVLFGSYGVWAKLIGGDMGVFFQGWSRGLIIVFSLLPFLYFKTEITDYLRYAQQDSVTVTLVLLAVFFLYVPVYIKKILKW